LQFWIHETGGFVILWGLVFCLGDE
jgi:hypothetical protein